jgi:menaquinone-dependent protoporphyrinogen oxidase
MKVLVIYATTEGHTRKIAEHVADRLHASGHKTVLTDADDTADANPANFDATIVAAPVYDGTYPASVIAFASARQSALQRTRSALLSVSLAAASTDPDDAAELDATVSMFTAQTRWQPDAVHHVMGALKCDRSDFFRRWALKLLSRETHVPSKAGECQLTDWVDLSRWTDAFVGPSQEAKHPPRSRAAGQAASTARGQARRVQ